MGAVVAAAEPAVALRGGQPREFDSPLREKLGMPSARLQLRAARRLPELIMQRASFRHLRDRPSLHDESFELEKGKMVEGRGE